MQFDGVITKILRGSSAMHAFQWTPMKTAKNLRKYVAVKEVAFLLAHLTKLHLFRNN